MKNFKKYEKYQKSQIMCWGGEAGKIPAALAAMAPNSAQWPPCPPITTGYFSTNL